jgi:hypothetical protein
MVEISVMEVLCGRAMRMSTGDSGRMAEPSAEVPEPAARPRSWQRAEVMHGQCTAQHKIPFKMSWGSVNCAERVGHHMPRSMSMRWRVALQPHSKVGELRGRMARPRWCRRAV